MTAITSEELTVRIDPALAVDRALTAAERSAFLQFVLIGSYDGAQPADWLDEADNSDAYGEHIDRWWEQHGDKAVAYLQVLHELPEALTRRLLGSALRATFAIASATLGERRRTHIEIASGAALWARGYGEALGWAPVYGGDS
jgi:hypothetical protein